jgi:hypothetical protein
MAKKTTPTWQLRGMAGPPPTDEHGYEDYGILFRASDPRRRFHTVRCHIEDTRWAIWSYYYWGKKVRSALGYVRRDAILTLKRWLRLTPKAEASTLG